MAAIHDIVGGRASGGEHVPPDGSDILAGLDGDDLGGGRGRVGGTVAGNRVRGHILDRPVVLGHANTTADTVVNAVDLERGKDGVRAGSTGEDESVEELHGGGVSWRVQTGR